MRWGITRTLIFAGLLVLAISSFNWLDQPDNAKTAEELKMANLKADYFLESFETIRYDQQGKPEYRLSGKTLTHYPARKASEILAPVVVLNRPQQPTWTMRSDVGLLQESDETVELSGDVAVLRDPFDGQSGIVIKTSKIKVQPKTHALETEADIEIKSEAWVLRSTGLKSDLRNGRIILLSNVQAHYENN